MTHFVFEIQKWEPSYTLSVADRRDRDGPYHETVLIELETACVLPKKLAGKKVTIDVFGKRNAFDSASHLHDPMWNARWMGLLDMLRSEGAFYTSMPHDSLPLLLASLAHGLFRYVLLWGPALSRGKSFCTSIEWKRSVDLEEGF